MPEAKLGHKIQQNYNKLSYKIYYKSAMIHKKRMFPYFQNKVNKIKNIKKNNKKKNDN